jgi:transcriptional regulator with XRE-family HTH domain
MENLKSPAEPVKLPELRAWLQRTGTTQDDLARMLHVSAAQVSRFLSGTRNLSIEAAVKLALMTEIPVEKLLTDGRAVRLLKLLGKQSNSTGTLSGEKNDVV